MVFLPVNHDGQDPILNPPHEIPLKTNDLSMKDPTFAGDFPFSNLSMLDPAQAGSSRSQRIIM